VIILRAKAHLAGTDAVSTWPEHFMSTPESDPRPVADGLQFDHAEYTAGPESVHPDVPVCTACKAPIAESYYEAGGQIVCGHCRRRIEEGFYGGSRLGRTFKALVLGSIAAAVGAGAYYAIMQMTGLNLGLVAVVVGVMVGGAVKTGSGNRGGRFYQILAVFLTYSSIVAMFAVPGIYGAIQNRRQAALARVAQDKGKPAQGPPKAQADPEKSAPVGTNLKDGPAAPPIPAEKKAPLTLFRALLLLGMFLVMLIGISYSIPIQIAFSSPISGLIFGFALWEAWKINRGVQLEFSGPFRMEAPRAGSAAVKSGGHPHDV
jgi:hypothetical protein